MYRLFRRFSFRVAAVCLMVGLLPMAGMASDKENVKLSFKRSVIEIRLTGSQVSYITEVPGSMVADLLGQKAVDQCLELIRQGWTSCMCKRTDWSMFSIQRNGSQTAYFYALYSDVRQDNGSPPAHDQTADPYAWRVGRASSNSSGLESLRVPFPE